MVALQEAVKRYRQALSIPSRLIQLHPGTVGNSGPASAIAPAVVTMTISAFEGFIEEFTATALRLEGDSFSRIAKIVGNWTNPDVAKWRDEAKKHFDVDLSVGFSVRSTRGVPSSNWSAKTMNLTEAVKHGSAWMNVRHALSHGEVAGRGAERWPTALRTGEPVSVVLRPKAGDATKHHLELPGARGCAALYTYAARHGADAIAAKLGQPPLTWTGLPDFDPAP